MAKKEQEEEVLSPRDMEVAIMNFRRAAWQRHEAARFLAGQRSYALDAVYLGGYTVECGLKALLLALTPRRRRNKVYRQISSGRVSHDLERLKQKLAEAGCPIPKDIARSFRQTLSWSTRLRYEVRRIEANAAISFLDATREVIDWVEGRATWPTPS